MRAVSAIILGLALAGPAAAQNPYSPALTVNEAVITHHDLDQRAEFLAALGATGDLRALAAEQLTEDRLRLEAARAAGLELTEAEIDGGIAEFAEQRGLSAEDVTQVLSARGIDRQTLEDFVEAGVAWRELVNARFRARAMPSGADLDAAIEVATGAPQESVTLAEIAIPFAERGDAETVAFAERLTADIRRGATSFAAAVSAYSRSASAEQGGRLPPLPARQLPPDIRGQVLLMRPGEVTNPIPITGGLAIIQLVAAQEEPPGAVDLASEEQREALREQLFSERIASFAQGYLQELMRDAVVTER
ncbi:hypothetical protein BH23PSE1_BH23PSE1_04150 [soil metagenome]